MTKKEEEHKKIYEKEAELRRKISNLIEKFSHDTGLVAAYMSLDNNEWYNGENGAPMYNIDIIYRPNYMV